MWAVWVPQLSATSPATRGRGGLGAIVPIRRCVDAPRSATRRSTAPPTPCESMLWAASMAGASAVNS